MRPTYITAFIIALIVVSWLISGQLSDDENKPASTVAEQNRNAALLAEEKPLVSVRVATSYGVAQFRELKVRGETMSKRMVDVKSQIDGTLLERVVERGDRVSAGDPLCRISIEDRAVALDEAKQTHAQARIEFEGSQKLAKQGLQSQTLIAQARARLASAKANLKRSELEMDRLVIKAPFEGLVEEAFLELGDFVSSGVTCVTLVGLDPMLLVGRVSEREVNRLQVGQIGEASLSSGEQLSGELTFVGKVADVATRTYAVELEIDNADYSIASGLTAEIIIPIQQVMAHKISPALLTLDDQGNIGIRTITQDNEVEFYLVNVVKEALDGVWVIGLPESVTIITVGQELVVAGETVVPTFETLTSSAPNLAPNATLNSPNSPNSPNSTNSTTNPTDESVPSEVKPS